MVTRHVRLVVGLGFVLLAIGDLLASVDSIGPNGINSNGLGLDGSGIAIGQVEGGRPGVPGADNAATCCNSEIIPTEVFARDMDADVNEGLSEHALQVAGVMISNQTTVPTPPPVLSPPVGVAQDAALYASAFVVAPVGVVQQDAAIAAQQLALHLAAAPTNVEVWAINMSFGLELDNSSNVLDGSSTLTQFVDWSAGAHDVLYVIAGNDSSTIGPGGPVPTDEYNGLTVAFSRKVGTTGAFRLLGANNDYSPNVDADGARTSTDIVAPGFVVDVAGPNGSVTPETGPSIAAPHVTGTVALLHQHAATQMAANPNARRHEVMKAVVMNSADKIQGILGMERTVLKQNGTDTWFQSNAHTTASIPLDIEMGAGHLNANRALQQFSPGQFAPGPVPLIGWDYNFVDETDDLRKYVFNQQFTAGSYVSATLVWDRQLALDESLPPSDEYNPGDGFFDFGFNNLDLHLLPAGSTNKNQAVWSSTSTAHNLEHMFAAIPFTGNYEIWVELNDQSFAASAAYALAWWAGAGQSSTSLGDYNGDQVVNAQDYTVWRSAFGATITAGTGADGNGNGVIDAADYAVWRNNLSAGSGSLAAVPEPTSAVLLVVAGAVFGGRFAARRRNERVRLPLRGLG